jgi:hypothetical protein
MINVVKLRTPEKCRKKSTPAGIAGTVTRAGVLPLVNAEHRHVTK